MYCQIPSQLKKAIRNKWPGFLTSAIIFFDDSTRPHAVRVTQNHLATLGWERLDLLPYVTDLSPSNYRLLSVSKKTIGGRSFGSKN